MKTPTTELLGIEHPIFQAAMSWASSNAPLVISGSGFAKGPDGMYRSPSGQPLAVVNRVSNDSLNRQGAFAIADYWKQFDTLLIGRRTVRSGHRHLEEPQVQRELATVMNHVAQREVAKDRRPWPLEAPRAWARSESTA